jgi:hypothetical protein
MLDIAQVTGIKPLLEKKGGRKGRFSFSFPRIVTVLKNT